MKILIMEGSGEVADRIAENLSGFGYSSSFVTNIHEVKRCMTTGDYDCVVLDFSFFKGADATIIREIRGINRHIGLIVTSQIDSLQDRVVALTTGADDFLTKPFEPAELSARVLALCRRRVLNHGEILVYKEIEIDLPAKRVSVNGIPLNLTKKELDLLMYFLDHKNSVIKKDNLITFLSGRLNGFTSNTDLIYAHVKNLKKKMNDAGCNMYLKTIYGIGYKWGE